MTQTNARKWTADNRAVNRAMATACCCLLPLVFFVHTSYKSHAGMYDLLPQIPAMPPDRSQNALTTLPLINLAPRTAQARPAIFHINLSRITDGSSLTILGHIILIIQSRH